MVATIRNFFKDRLQLSSVNLPMKLQDSDGFPMLIPNRGIIVYSDELLQISIYVCVCVDQLLIS